MSSRLDSAHAWASITPSTDQLSRIPVALMITADGDLQATDQEGTSLTVAVTAGQVIPFQPTVIGTSTTATVIALYND